MGALALDNLLLASYILIFPFLLIIIILLIVCIIYLAVREATESSESHAYVRASPGDEWTPVEPISKQRPSQSSKHQVDVIVCTCGKWNEPSQHICWNCSASLSPSTKFLQTFTFETAPRCAVCTFWVYPGERVILCPACQAQGHRAHMLEYLKAKGACPVCKRRFTADQFLTAIPIIGPSRELSHIQEAK
ncbi:MAG: hypothetical protein ACFFDP_11635 [Promethearchaeota archaeon]